MFPERIEADRIYLKKHEKDAAPAMFEAVDHDRARLREFLPWTDATQSVDDETAYVEMTLEKWNDLELFDFGMFRKSDSRYMGNIGLHSISWDNNRGEIGYWILQEFEGEGYVSEAVQALEKACFERGFHRLEIRCSSRNRRSARVPIRCGYQFEGRLRQNTIENSRYRDTLIFSKLLGQPAAPLSLTALDFVYVFTSDLKASRDWYEKVLGLQPEVDLPDFVEFRPGGLSGLCLHHADVKSPLSTGGSVGYWRVVDFESAVARFESHGARVYRGPLQIETGDRICQLLDPIGNVIGFVG